MTCPEPSSWNHDLHQTHGGTGSVGLKDSCRRPFACISWLHVLVVRRAGLRERAGRLGNGGRAVALRVSERAAGHRHAAATLELDAGAGRAVRRDVRQSACQILVASSQKKLKPGKADLWDSGQVIPTSRSRSAMAARRWSRGRNASGRCACGTGRVRHRTGASRGAGRWDCCRRPTGTGSGSGWTSPPKARRATNVLGEAQWIWFPEGQPDKAAPVGTRYFRRTVDLPRERMVKQGDSVLHRRRRRRLLHQRREGRDGGQLPCGGGDRSDLVPASAGRTCSPLR